MNEEELEDYLTSMEKKLLSSKKYDVVLTREWARTFPKKPGNYVVYEDDVLVYVGETGKIQGRMMDMLNTLNHCLRRNLGYEKFHNVPGFENATSKKKFPHHIEEKVDDFIESHITISSVETKLGRKELEERIIDNHGKPIYNKKGRRR